MRGAAGLSGLSALPPLREVIARHALSASKALDFDQGVNVTLGLPIVRTSPDHGTAFGIAGKHLANPGAMIAAIRMAGECAGRRRCA